MPAVVSETHRSNKERVDWRLQFMSMTRCTCCQTMDSFRDSDWDFLDYGVIEANTSTDFYEGNQSVGIRINETTSREECSRKRGRNVSCSNRTTKACREKLRRENLNERFSELRSILEPCRPAITDKSAIIGDAIRVLNQLKTESQDMQEANKKLQEDIKALKAEKNELRQEKIVLKADKERVERQLKAVTGSSMHNVGASKMAVLPSYGVIPMWQCIHPSTLDTSQDHELRPPAA